MKTFTEFDGFLVTKWLPIYTQLGTEGKTPEEVTAAMGEQTKYEGEKLTAFLYALEVIKDKAERLKRIVAMTLSTETEKPSDKLLQKENYFFGIEYFAEMKKTAPAPRQDERGGRGGDRGKGRGGDRKPGGPGRGGNERGPRPEGGAPGQDRAAGGAGGRPPRGRRPEGAAGSTEGGAGGPGPGFGGGRPPRRDDDRPRKKFEGDKRGGSRGPKKEFDPNAPGRLIAVGFPPEFRKKEDAPKGKIVDKSSPAADTSSSPSTES